MGNALSLRALCVISICLATASITFCWKWTASTTAVIAMQEREIEALKVVRDDLEFRILNLGSLVVHAAQGAYGSDRPLPVIGFGASGYADLMSSPRMQTLERARADDFLYWYYMQMKRWHSGLEDGGSAVECADAQIFHTRILNGCAKSARRAR